MVLHPAASTSPSAYRRLAQQQFIGLIVRFLGVILLSWTLQWRIMPMSQWHGVALHAWFVDPLTWISISYCVASTALFFGQMIWVHKHWLFVAASVCDGLLSAGLLALYPDIAWMGFAISLTAMLAMFQGLTARFILGLSIVLAAFALIVAHFADILADSAPLPVHGIQILCVVFALMSAWRFEQNTLNHKDHLESDIHPATGLPRVKALHTSLHYLLPYHQRNKIPMSLVMLHTVCKDNDSPAMQTLATKILARIRKSDVLVQLDDDILAILLCDTSVSGASALARDLTLCLADMVALDLTFAVSPILLDHTAIDPLLIRMRDALKHAMHQQTKRIIFVNEERLEHINL